MRQRSLAHAPLRRRPGYRRTTSLRRRESVPPAPIRAGTPLELFDAIQRGDRAKIGSLLGDGADLNLHHPLSGATPLTLAVEQGELEWVQALLAAGAEPNVASRADGATPLLVASRVGRPEMTWRLLDAGADVNQADVWGRTPWQVALAATPLSPELVWTLMNVAEAELDFCPRHAARLVPGLVAESRWDARRTSMFLHVLLERGVNLEGFYLGATALMHASCPKILSWLLSRGAKLHSRDERGWTALHHAAHRGLPAACNVLLDAGAGVDDPTSEGQHSPLFLALYGTATTVSAHVETVQTLLARGANPNARWNDSGLTPLMAAAGLTLPSAGRLCLALHEGGADLDAQDAEGRTALHHALQQGQVFNALELASLAPRLVRDAAGYSPLLRAQQLFDQTPAYAARPVKELIGLLARLSAAPSLAPEPHELACLSSPTTPEAPAQPPSVRRSPVGRSGPRRPQPQPDGT